MITEPSVGTEIIYNCEADGLPVDLSQFVGGMWLVFKGPHPARTEVEKPAVIRNAPGDDGKLVYRKEEGFLTSGKWQYRPHLRIDDAHNYWGEWREFPVLP